jgi:MinD superfamily P-loop ATPase
VTEPTPFGRHDLEAALTVCRELDVPVGVILNRADIGDSGTDELLRERGVPLLLRVPHDRAIAAATAAGRPLTEVRPELVPELRRVAEAVRDIATGVRA